MFLIDIMINLSYNQVELFENYSYNRKVIMVDIEHWSNVD